jgi:hypothetical protein
MRLIPSDPDVKTLYGRIIDGDIDLQPDFQRGEVWGEAKKARLIDSILREWHVPPIHVIEIKNKGQEVLDGQQRLVAIRDFMQDKIKVNGYIEPLNEDIKELDGLYYSQLPDNWRKKFEKFTIRVYSITDYLPSEPGELFYRLNQPTNLTSAEQRNAFFGKAREQVKDLVRLFDVYNLGRNEIGFSNSRMAYDDVIARMCIYLESKTLQKKVTAMVLANKYRLAEGFSDEIIENVSNAITIFADAVKNSGGAKFNKATLLTWLIFIYQLSQNSVNSIDNNFIGQFIGDFEIGRSNYYYNYEVFLFPHDIQSAIFNVYNDRSTSRVADVSSVLLRDLITWVMFYQYSRNFKPDLFERYINLSFRYMLNSVVHDITKSIFSVTEELHTILEKYNWGQRI